MSAKQLTVRQLIAKLKKLDPEAVLAWRDHDQSVNEINGFVRTVGHAESELLADPYVASVLAKYGDQNIVVLGP
jgi:hypothetical protein